MKPINIQYIKAAAVACACAIGIGANAQDYSPAALEQLKQQRLWMHSQNAAGMAYDDTRDYSSVTFNYNTQSGNFHTPTDGKKQRTVGVDCEGYIDLGNVLVWGVFNFDQENLTNAGYNASIADPDRGMPYYVVDDLHSNWRNQHYNLRFRAASRQVAKRWTFGIEGGYVATLAAKQRDPRVDTRFYTLELIPGVGFQINDNNRVGIDMRYTSIKEDSRMDKLSSSYDPTYYVMFGLGVAEMSLGSGVTTNYIGDRLGGAVQYNYASGTFNLLAEVSYDRHAETVQHSYSTPRKIAGINDHTVKASLSAINIGDNYTNYFTASYTNSDIDGIQYVTQRDNSENQTGWMEIFKTVRSTYKTRNVAAEYYFSRNRGAEYSWKVGIGAYYTNKSDKYLYPAASMDAENLLMKVDLKKNFALNEKHNARLLLEGSVGFNNNISGDYQYDASHPEYPTVTELMTGKSHFENSNFQTYHLGLTYSQIVREGSKVNVFANAGITYNHTSDWDYSQRTLVSVKLGCNF